MKCFVEVVRLMRCFLKCLHLFAHDFGEFIKYSGSINETVESSSARLVMSYHILEKGLTMPRRRLGFGKAVVRDVMSQVATYGQMDGHSENVRNHAVGVLKAYLELHEKCACDFSSDISFWKELREFCALNSSCETCTQKHFTRESFFADTEKAFPFFAASRHTCRHFSGHIPDSLLREAVRMAMTSPSACNRQPVKVIVVSNNDDKAFVLSHQNGNRGFGNDADRLLLVVSDLSDIRWHEERNDVYLNAGLYLMNLIYALHYSRIASCVLNWSVSPSIDRMVHKHLSIPGNLRITAVLACGIPPQEFDVADSPRRPLSEVLWDEGGR